MPNTVIASFASLIRYSALVSPRIVMLKDGCLLAGFRYTGTDLDATPMLEKSTISVLANNALKKFGQGFMFHFETVRVPSTNYPEGHFSEGVTAIIDKERQVQFESYGSHYETRTFCFLTWEPPLLEKSSVRRKLFSFVMGTEPSKLTDDKWIESFENGFVDFMNSLTSIFSIEQLEDDSLLSALNLCINCRESGLVMPEVPCDLDSLFARDVEIGSPLVYDNRYVAAVSIDGFPQEAYPCILDALGKLPFEYRWSSRFIPLDFRAAYSKMSKEQKKWAQKRFPMLSQILDRPTTKINKDAVVQEEDVNEALQSLHEGLVSYGHYTCVVILRDDDLEHLNYCTREAVSVLEKLVFSVRVEHRNTIEAFIGSLPGHGYENIRKPLIHSLNLSHLLLLSSTWPGLAECPCPFYPPHSPALVQTTAAGGNPFRLHLHVGDVGHTLILGPTGSGKSTLLATIAAQFDRYENSQIFLFDKGRSMFPLVSAMGNGSFYNLGSENSPSLCPLAELSTQADISWAIEYAETLITLNGGTVTPERRGLINIALQAMSKGTSTSRERTLTDLRTNIQDSHIKNTLDIYTVNGPYGVFLDGEETQIKYSRVTAFELEELMGHGEKVVTPTLLYLFHEIEKRLDGRPTLIILDEAWLALGTPLFAAKLKEWLKVLRKANAAVVLATQNLTDILNSDISSVVMDSCPTKILLPNPDAKTENMMRLYIDQLHLNSAEASAIAKARQKQDYFYVSPYGRRMFRLNLGDVALAFVGASGKDDLKRITELKELHGKDWPAVWLAERGCEDWAKLWPSAVRKVKEVKRIA